MTQAAWSARVGADEADKAGTVIVAEVSHWYRNDRERPQEHRQRAPVPARAGVLIGSTGLTAAALNPDGITADPVAPLDHPAYVARHGDRFAGVDVGVLDAAVSLPDSDPHNSRIIRALLPPFRGPHQRQRAELGNPAFAARLFGFRVAPIHEKRVALVIAHRDATAGSFAAASNAYHRTQRPAAPQVMT